MACNARKPDNALLYGKALLNEDMIQWHTYAGNKRSSQVLCISAFGTLRNLTEKDAILNTFFRRYLNGVKPGMWTVTPEGTDRELLGESQSQPTSIDMLFTSPETVICMESKFIADARNGFGRCNQYGKNCEGFYGPGSDRKCGTNAWCRLENWDGKRSPRFYWAIGKRYFRSEVFRMQKKGDTCPFRRFYQLMRNILFAASFAERGDLPCWRVALISPAGNNGLLEDQIKQFKKDILIPEFHENLQLLQYDQYISILKSYSGEPEKLGEFLESAIELNAAAKTPYRKISINQLQQN